MSWINSRKFSISNRNDRYYVFHRNSTGNTEINIPASIITKTQAVAWLKAHPNKVSNPTRYRPKRGTVGATGPMVRRFVNRNGHLTMIITGPVAGKLKTQYFDTNGKMVKEVIQSPTYFVNSNRAKGMNIPWNYTCTLRKELKVFKQVGKGRQGVVFLASRYASGRFPFAIKVAARDKRAGARKEEQPAQYEFKIHKAVEAVAPDGVVGIHQLIDCAQFIPLSQLVTTDANSVNFDKSRQMIILMEYCSEGSLKDYMKQQGVILNDVKIKDVISQVLKTLFNIKKAYPDFNHNDLHLDNLFVNNRGVLIGDFGWARLEKNGTNPAVNTANGTKTASFWGVGPLTDTRYDHHLFLNEIRSWILSHGGAARFPKALAFADMAIPSGYRGGNDTHVSEWRLKYNDPCPDLPSLLKLVRTRYISGAKRLTSPNLLAAKALLRRVGPSPKKKLVTSAQLVAAKARLRRTKNYTNKQLINIPVSNFLKLSPKTRERVKVLKAAAKKPVNRGKAAARPVVVNKKVEGGKKVKVPPALLRMAKFNKLVEKIWINNGAKSNANYANAWSSARVKAIAQVASRLSKNLPAFTPSPMRTKLPSPLSPLGPPKPRAKPKKVNFNFKLSPSSGRAKIKAPNSGRYVYANGSTISLEYLKSIAAQMGVEIKGLRSKANIAKKIFGSNSK